ncbi:ATP-binding protein [Metallosphaera tengchongensis]|uniref:ATP-binding protein n=1 Tax=Metallosphaera tengchongensis TaxID=1532350 RepID=A0A6N0NX47_9CREN|nr:ATP-binding protein [Metallosphaera tengchongensis]QKQ99679.1 ATP-binding protein [Metallosphaera tengchongensis]
MIDELYNGVKDRAGRARALAVTLGSAIGRISKYIPNKIDQENLYVNVVVDPNTYYSFDYLGRIGILLGTVDIRTLQFILLQVVGYERSDITSSLFNSNDLTPKMMEDEDPGTLIGNVILKCEMLTRLDPLTKGEALPADIIPEPQSPVIIPYPEMIERAMSINRGRLKFGFLEVSNSEAKVGIPPEELNFHALVIGTTGAGKTSFIKDVIASLLKTVDDEQIVVFDATGDYYHSFLPPDFSSETVRRGLEDFQKLNGPLEGVEENVIFPVTVQWVRRNLTERNEEEITKTYFDLYVRPLLEHIKKRGIETEIQISGRTISLETKGWKSKINVNPFYLSFKENVKIIHKLNPYFSEQASHFLKIMTSEIKDVINLEEFIETINEERFEKLQVHKSTRENILRGLYLLRETGLFDIRVPRTSLNDILSSSKFIVIDLYNQELDDFSQKILTYYFLDRIFSLRERKMRSGETNNRLLMVIDEAHRFFPSARGGEEDNNYVRRVAGKISTLMRLGRRRRIGFLFSTHNPNDLSDIIVQLANTKFVFRVSLEISENLGLTKTDAKILSWERNGVAYMISPWLRQGKLKIRIPVPPPLGHYDLSRT